MKPSAFDKLFESLPDTQAKPSSGSFDKLFESLPANVGYGSQSEGGRRSRQDVDALESYYKANHGRVDRWNDRNIAGTNKKSTHAVGNGLDVFDVKNASAIIEKAKSTPGVKVIIYNRRIETKGADGQWRSKPYSGKNPHTDHVHVDFGYDVDAPAPQKRSSLLGSPPKDQEKPRVIHRQKVSPEKVAGWRRRIDHLEPRIRQGEARGEDVKSMRKELATLYSQVEAAGPMPKPDVRGTWQTGYQGPGPAIRPPLDSDPPDYWQTYRETKGQSGKQPSKGLVGDLKQEAQLMGEGARMVGDQTMAAIPTMASEATEKLGQKLYGAPEGWFKGTPAERDQAAVVGFAQFFIPILGQTQIGAMGLSTAGTLAADGPVQGAKQIGEGLIHSVNFLDPEASPTEKAVRGLTLATMVMGGLHAKGRLSEKNLRNELVKEYGLTEAQAADLVAVTKSKLSQQNIDFNGKIKGRAVNVWDYINTKRVRDVSKLIADEWKVRNPQRINVTPGSLIDQGAPPPPPLRSLPPTDENIQARPRPQNPPPTATGAAPQPKGPTPGGAPIRSESGAGKIEMMPVSGIKVHPDLQYKLSEIEDPVNNVSKQFKNVDVFDRAKAGVLDVWEDLEGNRFALNSHHRRELGIRASRFVDTSIKPGELTDVPRDVPVMVLREVDGWDLPKARAYGALQNISDGKGTAFDAVNALRDAGFDESNWRADFQEAGINLSSKLVRHINGLINLPEESLSYVRNRALSEDLLAGIGSIDGLSRLEQAAVIESAYGAVRSGSDLTTFNQGQELARRARGKLMQKRAADTADSQGGMFDDDPDFSATLENLDREAEIIGLLKKRITSERADLLKIPESILEGERIDRGGRMAKASELGQSGREAKDRVDFVFEKDAELSALLDDLARRVVNGEQTAAEAAKQLYQPTVERASGDLERYVSGNPPKTRVPLPSEGSAGPDGATPPRAQSVAAPPRPKAEDVHTLATSEIEKLADAARQHSRDVEAALFGEEGAKRYRKLLASEGSMDSAKARAASEERDRMESALSEADRNLLHGLGEEDFLAPEDLMEMSQKAIEIDEARNAKELGFVLSKAIQDAKGSREVGPVTMFTIMRGQAKAEALGVNPTDVMDAAVVRRLIFDGKDAAELLGMSQKEVDAAVARFRDADAPKVDVLTPDQKGMADLEPEVDLELRPEELPQRKGPAGEKPNQDRLGLNEEVDGQSGLELNEPKDIYAKIEARVREKLAILEDKVPGYRPRKDVNAEQLQLALDLYGDRILRPEGELLALGIPAEVKATAGIALVGKPVVSAEALASLAQVLRDPRWETIRYVFAANNRVVDVVSYSSRLPGASAVFPGDRNLELWLKGHYADTKADAVWLLHNHPSGRSTPSREDIKFTMDVAQYDGINLAGHVVINSNEYAVIDRNGDYEVIQKEFHSGPDRNLEPSRPHPALGMEVSPEDLAFLGSQFKKEGMSVIIGTTPQLRVRSVYMVDSDFLAKASPKRIMAFARRLARSTGSADLFLITDQSNIMRTSDTQMRSIASVYTNVFKDIVTFEGISIQTEKLAQPQKNFFYGNHGLGIYNVADPKAPYPPLPDMETPATPETGKVEPEPPGIRNSDADTRKQLGRDFDTSDQFRSPLGIYDQNGNPIVKGSYYRVGKILTSDGQVKNAGEVVDKRIRSAERAITAANTTLQRKLDGIEQHLEASRKRSKLAKDEFYEQFIELIEKDFDDPTRKATDQDIHQALEMHDEIADTLRRYIIDSRRSVGIEMPDDWGITEKGYFRHLFLGDIQIIVNGSPVDSTGNLRVAKTYAEAQKKALDIQKEEPGASIVIRARNTFFGDPTVRVSTKKYFKTLGEISDRVEIPMEEVMEDLRGVVGQKKNRAKFFGALIQRKGVKGYSKVYMDVMRAHAAQAVRTQELTKLIHAIQPLVEQMNKGGKPGLARAIQAHMDFLWGTPTDGELRFGQFIENHPVLGDRVAMPALALRGLASQLTSLQFTLKLQVSPKAAAVNLLQPFTTLWPYVSSAEFAKLYADFIKPETRKMLLDRGVFIGATKVESGRTVLRKRTNVDFFSSASEVNRGVGYLYGYRHGKRQGLGEEGAHKLGLSWAERVEFDNVWNSIPALRSPAGKVFGQFKGFTVKNLESLGAIASRRSGESITTTVRRLSKWMIAQGILGGIKSFGALVAYGVGGYPIVQVLREMMEGMGMEPDDAHATALSVWYGAPALVGQSLSASVNIFDEPYGNSTKEKITNFVFGPTVGTVATILDRKDQGAKRIAEGITPAAKMYDQGKQIVEKGVGNTTVQIGKPDKEPTEDDPEPKGDDMPLTDFESIMRALGFTPLKQTEHYDRKDAGLRKAHPLYDTRDYQWLYKELREHGLQRDPLEDEIKAFNEADPSKRKALAIEIRKRAQEIRAEIERTAKEFPQMSRKDVVMDVTRKPEIKTPKYESSTSFNPSSGNFKTPSFKKGR